MESKTICFFVITLYQLMVKLVVWAGGLWILGVPLRNNPFHNKGILGIQTTNAKPTLNHWLIVQG